MPGVQTMIISPTFGQFVFDSVLSTEHSSTVTVTKHPVQYGASITDHAVNEPDEVSVSVGMTDAAAGVDENHSVNAFGLLKQIMEKREPVTLVTRLKTYQNMVITSMSVPDDYTTMNALKATIIFTHVEIVPVSVVTIQQTVSSSKTKSTSSGGKAGKKGGKKKKSKDKPTKDKGKTILKKIDDATGGLGTKVVNAVSGIFKKKG